MPELGKQQSLRLSIAVAAGTGIGTITNDWSLVRWLRIKPIAETDSFDVSIKDADGIIMFSRVGQIGTLAERIEMSLGIMRTITIINATQDGTYNCRLDMH